MDYKKLIIIIFLSFFMKGDLLYAQQSEAQLATVESIAESENITLDFKEADIRNVLKIIAMKAGINIVATPEVMGTVSIRLENVPWQKALEVILKTYGFAYERVGNIITVAPIEKLTNLKKQESELYQIQPTITEVFHLKYIDALDAKKALEPQLSPRGKITVLEMTGQAGWEFGGEELGKRKRVAEERLARSKVLIISDIPAVIDRLKEVIDKIDIKPQQVLIEARIMEVNRDRLKDIGFDIGTGTSGASGYATAPTDIGLSSEGKKTLGGRNLGSEFTPSIFTPQEGITTFPGTYPYKAGLELIFKKLTGTEFEAILHALEEDIHTNVLSAPRIMALNNQEATILIGTRYPIIKKEYTTTTAGASTVSGESLDYYQDIGIQLNVVPQIGADNYINMVIHPAVTDYTTTKGTNEYPIIETREAETRILMKDGETVVIGGLLKDVKKKQIIGIPFLNKIPILGILFKREIVDTAKIDLLIFITARIVKEGEFTTEKISELKTNLGKEPKINKK
ncbi:MAG: type IV pilus secretin PilQ [Candidatus Omnitrophica bacterium]|nr:type IV pilus secretin PilQ [Candidatus Omnitrophota bacterium]MCM8799535.1 type IV pilus secretin PilQ [Candidatus Omnitrophota bacterium]